MSRLRPATPFDLNFVRACAQAAYAPYVKRIGQEPAPMIADFEQHIRKGEVTIADSADGKPCGYVICRAVGDHVLLENIAVDPAQHGEGHGRALIEYVEWFARQQKVPVVRLYTNIQMRENLSLYPALGYQETERKTEDGFDRVFFEKAVD
ncbi:MAG: GNAT family N-acetyltransferase [Pseudomonadota bacterium]